MPSYATSIGSSADRPAALAELVGILVNNGVYAPGLRIEKMHFAAGTPYETVLRPAASRAEQVMKPEVARVARRELLGVVEHGTATRIAKAFTRPDGTTIDVGGKTGTGDNRFDVYNAAGDLVRSTAINRTATFVFFIGERFFGTLTAYVPGQQAAELFLHQLPSRAGAENPCPQAHAAHQRHRARSAERCPCSSSCFEMTGLAFYSIIKNVSVQ